MSLQHCYRKVTGSFGDAGGYYDPNLGHGGTDYYSDSNDSVLAYEDGVVGYTGSTGWGGGVVGMKMDAGGYAGWAHLDPIAVSVDQRVKAGDVIGYTAPRGGNHGTSWTGPHIHTTLSTQSSMAAALGYRPLQDPAPRIAAALNQTTVGGIPMFAPYWTGPQVNNTHVSGRIVTGYGSFWVPTPQIMNLLNRRHSAALKPGDTNDQMLDAEHDIINGFLQTCFKSSLTGVALDAAKLRSALTDALKAAGTNIVVEADTDVPVDKLAAAFEIASPRIAAAMVKQAGQAMAK